MAEIAGTERQLEDAAASTTASVTRTDHISWRAPTLSRQRRPQLDPGSGSSVSRSRWPSRDGGVSLRRVDFVTMMWESARWTLPTWRMWSPRSIT